MSFKKITIYIDFDGVLFDVEKFKNALARALLSLGISKRQFWQKYKLLRRHNPFSIKGFVCLLSDDAVMRRKYATALNKCLKQSDKFVYSDTIGFIKFLRKCGTKIVLYSFGNREFQMQKIKNAARLRHLFDRIIITECSQKNTLKPNNRHLSIMIDDREDVLLYYSRKFGVIPLLVRRK